MAHAHIVSDSDNHFVIDPISRQLINNSKKTILMKTDHNSEQFTFELPRMVDGHDMSLSNKVEVHYININSKTREQSTGIYNVADFGVDAEDNTKVLGTWLVSREATKYAGSLNFVIRFACLSADNVEEYAWNTAIYAGITIADTIENTETVVEDYVDILRQWLDTIENAGSSGKVYVITDDGTFTELGEMVNNFSTQVTELDGKMTDLETSNTEFKDTVNGTITEFKESINSEVTGFKESVNSEVTGFKEQITEQQTTLETTVNGFDDRITTAENFATIFQDDHMLTGTFGKTVIGTEGTFLIRYGDSNLILTKKSSSDKAIGHIFALLPLSGVTNKYAISVTEITIENEGKVTGFLGDMSLAETQTGTTKPVVNKLIDLTNMLPTFKYRKLS